LRFESEYASFLKLRKPRWRVNRSFLMRPANRYKPDGRECALLLLQLIDEREGRRKGRKGGMTRVRLAEVTLKDLWNRELLTDGFLRDVQDWLLTAGWTLFYAGKTFGAVKTAAVQNWPRASSTRLTPTLVKVKSGKFNFDDLAHFIPIEEREERRSGARDNTDE
jgi:hypothetical protein